MAAVTANADIRKFHTNGGVLTIANATDTYTLKNIEPGGLSFADGQTQVHEYYNDGALEQPLAGNNLPSRIDITLRLGDLANSDEKTIFDLLATAPTSGKLPEFTVVIKIPDYRGASTGTQITYANCYIAPDGKPTVTSESDGTAMATTRFAFHSRTPKGTRAEY